jgi:AcrR family transcriptional regulator
MKTSSPPRRRGRPRTFDRNEALNAALRVFRERGYEGATLAELQEAMGGISPPSLYAAFVSKEALFKEAVTLHRDSVARVTSSALDAPGLTAREAIDRMLRATAAAFTKAGEPPGCPLVLGAITCSSEGESVSHYLHELRVKTYRLILARIRRGVGDGDIRSRANVEALAMFVTTFVHGLSIQARDGASRAALTAAVDCAMSAWDGFVA